MRPATLEAVTAIRPEPTSLVGRFIRLEPLQAEHLPTLFEAIGHPIVFAGGYGGGAAGYRDSLEAFTTWAADYFRWESDNPYAVILVGGPHDGTLVGTSTLADFDTKNESTHLGWTAYDPRVWGTAVNAEAKLLMLGLAFASGFGRVKIQADAANERSRAAITAIGATFEGISRRDMRRADGSWRDTAVFSVIADDWPRVRSGLLERLEIHTAPVLFRTRPRT